MQGATTGQIRPLSTPGNAVLTLEPERWLAHSNVTSQTETALIFAPWGTVFMLSRPSRIACPVPIEPKMSSGGRCAAEISNESDVVSRFEFEFEFESNVCNVI